MPDCPARLAVLRLARIRAGPRPSATLSRWPGPGWPRTRPSAPGSRAARTASSARPGSPRAPRQVPIGRLGHRARQAARRRRVPPRGGTRRTRAPIELTVPPGRREVWCRRIPARAGRPLIQAGMQPGVPSRLGPTRGGWPRIQARRGLAVRPGRLVQTRAAAMGARAGTRREPASRAVSTGRPMIWIPVRTCPAELSATTLTRVALVPARPGPGWPQPDRTVPGPLAQEQTALGRFALRQAVLCRLTPGQTGPGLTDQSRAGGAPAVPGRAIRAPSPAGWAPADWASTAPAPTVARPIRCRRLALRPLGPGRLVLGPRASPPVAGSGHRPAAGGGQAAEAVPEWGSRRGRA
jgi:hypothetical protein